jgi:hypothetical protein
MATDDEDRMTSMEARERLRGTEVEVKGNILPGHVKGHLTEDGLKMLFDSLSIGGFKIVRK